MFQIYNCLVNDHDLVTLSIGLMVCVFGATISLAIGKRGLLTQGKTRRLRLCLASLLTGLTIWSTHFAAMLAYTPAVDVRFGVLATAASATLAVLIAGCAWFILAVEGRFRGIMAGCLIGLALCIAHFLDMSALKVAGIVFYDHQLTLVALAVGFPLCVASGALLRSGASAPPWQSATALVGGIMSLHLIAMAAVRIVPVATADFSPLDLGINGLTVAVIASSSLILIVGVGLALHDLEMERVTAAERERLRKSEEHYRYSVELNPQIPWIADSNGYIREISPRWAEIVGPEVATTAGTGWLANVHPDDVDGVLNTWKSAVADRADSADVRYRLRCIDGSYRWFRARARPRLDEAGEVMLWYGNLEDIHDQVNSELALRASEERYRLASLATNDVIWDANISGNRIEWSGAVKNVLGYPGDRFGTSRQWWLERIHPDERPGVVDYLKSILRSNAESWKQEFRFRAKDGHYVDLLTRGHVVRDALGTPLRMVGSLMDITAKKRTDNELRWAANHDPLTYLPNRKLFAMRLDAALVEAVKTNLSAGLIVIDVDRFKTLNDTLGHGTGDAVLREVAKRLQRNVPKNATVARLGGDEFAIIMPGLTEEDARRETLDRILAGMNTPFTYDGRDIDISLSIGAARFPADGDTSEALLKSADLALYAAKAEGLGRARGFRPIMREAAESEKRMLGYARQALLEEQIVPFYQPKICLRSGQITGFEALLRWHHHDRGIQPPSSLLAALDDPRLAPEITDRMLAQTLLDMARWLDQGHEFGRIAINSSTEDFRRGDLADRILGSLAKAGIPPSRLELEVTETVFLGKHAGEVENTLRALRDEDVAIALDDFGTGYASLTHLQQFPVNTIKIDRSFVSRLISEEQQDAIIVGALIDLAKNLGISTVAEGVETELQAFVLRRRGCDAAQGYFFERAMPAMRIPAFIGGWRSDKVLDNWRLPAVHETR